MFKCPAGRLKHPAGCLKHLVGCRNIRPDVRVINVTGLSQSATVASNTRRGVCYKASGRMFQRLAGCLKHPALNILPDVWNIQSDVRNIRPDVRVINVTGLSKSAKVKAGNNFQNQIFETWGRMFVTFGCMFQTSGRMFRTSSLTFETWGRTFETCSWTFATLGRTF